MQEREHLAGASDESLADQTFNCPNRRLGHHCFFRSTQSPCRRHPSLPRDNQAIQTQRYSRHISRWIIRDLVRRYIPHSPLLIPPATLPASLQNSNLEGHHFKYLSDLLSTKMMETRSQTRQLYSQRPSYPQISSDSPSTSSTTSAFNSSASLELNSATTSASSSAPSSVNMSQQLFASAPMPSPSHSQRQAYFGASLSAQGPTSHPEQHAPQQPRPSFSQQHVGQRGDGSGPPATAPFLQDFNLVAEAAKRAQTACLMRDFDEMEL